MASAITNLTPQALSNLVASARDIRDIRGPVAMGVPSWVWWLLAVAVASLAGWLLWRKYRARPGAVNKSEVVLTPDWKAKQQLREAASLMHDPRLYCFRVSEIIRAYLEEQFGYQAPDRTTDEFLEELRQSSRLESEPKAMLSQLLVSCDMVKFARYEPGQQEVEAIQSSAFNLIEVTVPKFMEPASPTQATAPS